MNINIYAWKRMRYARWNIINTGRGWWQRRLGTTVGTLIFSSGCYLTVREPYIDSIIDCDSAFGRSIIELWEDSRELLVDVFMFVWCSIKVSQIFEFWFVHSLLFLHICQNHIPCWMASREIMESKNPMPCIICTECNISGEGRSNASRTSDDINLTLHTHTHNSFRHCQMNENIGLLCAQKECMH